MWNPWLEMVKDAENREANGEPEFYGAECPDCGAWYPESWEVNEHIARDHYGQDDAQ